MDLSTWTTRWMTPIIVVMGVGLCADAWAADTTEPFELGVSNIDLYAGIDELGVEGHGPLITVDTMLGVGITPWLSYYLGAALYADGHAEASSGDLYTGLCGTPLDTDHVDLDLCLEARLERLAAFTIAPGFELNLDLKPNLALAGLYLRATFPVSQGGESGPYATDAALITTWGAYLTIQVAHMLHLEFDMTLPLTAHNDGRDVTLGGLALGYNVTLSKHIELITQVALDIPQGDEPLALGLLTGFVATIP